jgi:hypothetical protein
MPTQKHSTKFYTSADIAKHYYSRPLRCPQHTRHTRAATQYRLQLLNMAMDPDSGQLLDYRKLIAATSPTRDLWLNSMGNEVARLAQGHPTRGAGTNTIVFINK